MVKTELLKLIETLGETDDVMPTLQGIEGLSKTFDVKSIGLDDFKTVLESNDIAKSYFQSALDSGIGKGVAKYQENFKSKELPKLIDEGIKAKSNEGKSEIEIKYEEMKKEIESMKTEKARAELSSKYQKVLVEKGLPVDLTDFILGDGSEETINGNIEKFSNMFSSVADLKVKEKLGDSTYTPPKNDGVSVGKITWEQVVENPSLMAQYNQQAK